MKLPNGINPAHCASTDKTRYSMMGVCVDDGLAYATNGRILVATECELEPEDEPRRAIIPTRIAKKGFATKPKDLVLPRIYLKQLKPAPDMGIDAKEPAYVKLLNRELDRTTAKEVDGNFPHVENVVPDLNPYTIKISFNIKLLTQIAKALNSEKINLFATGDEKDPFLIVSKKNEEDAFGLLMPLRNEIDLLKNRPLKKLLKLKRSALEKQLQEKGNQS